MISEIKNQLQSYNGEWSEKNGVHEFKALIAQRKAFLSKKKLNYSAKVKIDEAVRIVKFSEMLIEKGSGFSSGGGFDGDVSAGFGFKKEVYKTTGGAREGSIEEQSNLFGKKYEYKFDYKEIRAKVEGIAQKAGYRFEYQVSPVK